MAEIFQVPTVDFTEEAVFGPWTAFAGSDWPWRECHNIRFLTDVRMHDNQVDAIRQIAFVIPVDLGIEEIEKVCQLNSFEFMQSIEHTFYPPEPTPLAQTDRRRMARYGKRGSLEDFLASAQQAHSDTRCRQRLFKLVRDFPDAIYHGNSK